MAVPDVEILAVRLFTIFLTHLPDGTGVYSSRGGEFESVYGVESCKIAFLWVTFYSLVQTLLLCVGCIV